jgi:hypothetical protein
MPSRDAYEKLNIVLNVALILSGILLAGLVYYQVFYKSSLVHLEAEFLRANQSFLGLQEISFHGNADNILLAIDVNCPYSSQAIPFFRELISRGKHNHNMRVIALFNDQKEAVETYLREHDLDTDFIANVDLAEIKVDLSPTIIWVDADRKIIGSYQGLLNESQRKAFYEFYESRFAQP